MSNDVSRGVGLGCGLVFGVLAGVCLLGVGTIVLCGGILATSPTPRIAPERAERAPEIPADPIPAPVAVTPEQETTPAVPIAPPVQPMPTTVAVDDPPESNSISDDTIADGMLRAAMSRAGEIETTADVDRVADSIANVVDAYPETAAADNARSELAGLARLRLALHHAETQRDPSSMLRLVIDRHDGTVAATIAERMLTAAP